MLVEIVVMRDGLAYVAVLLRCPRGGELLELEPVVDDGLQQVQRPEGVRHHGLVRAMPRLADVRLRAEVEDVGTVVQLAQLSDQVVDGRLVGEIGEVDDQLPVEVADVVQRAARGRAHEGVNVRVEGDERLRQVRAHEAVRSRDQAGSSCEEVAVVAAQRGQRLIRPGGVGSVWFHQGSAERGGTQD